MSSDGPKATALIMVPMGSKEDEWLGTCLEWGDEVDILRRPSRVVSVELIEGMDCMMRRYLLYMDRG